MTAVWVLSVFWLFLIVCLFQARRVWKKPPRRYGDDARRREHEYHPPEYNIYGINAEGKYNRFYDVAQDAGTVYNRDGFLNPRYYPIALTTHARQRMRERMNVWNEHQMDTMTHEAYCFGKSARQLKKSSAQRVWDIERQYPDSILLLYHGYVYVFSHDNVLITVYRNQNIAW